MKKTTAILLTLVMVMTMGMTAFAASGETTVSIEVQKDAKQISAEVPLKLAFVVNGGKVGGQTAAGEALVTPTDYGITNTTTGDNATAIKVTAMKLLSCNDAWSLVNKPATVDAAGIGGLGKENLALKMIVDGVTDTENNYLPALSKTSVLEKEVSNLSDIFGNTTIASEAKLAITFKGYVGGSTNDYQADVAAGDQFKIMYTIAQATN